MISSSVKTRLACGLLVLVSSVPVYARPQRYIFRDDPEALFTQVRSDLDRAQHDAFPRDTDSMEKARGELNELERQWDHLEPTSRQAGYVVAALERVLSQNHLSFGDHSRLSDDMDKMRRFRDDHQ